MEDSEEPEDIVAEGDGKGEAEHDVDQDVKNSAVDKSDCKFKVQHYITLYIMLPNDDEDLMIDFE